MRYFLILIFIIKQAIKIISLVLLYYTYTRFIYISNRIHFTFEIKKIKETRVFHSRVAKI